MSTTAPWRDGSCYSTPAPVVSATVPPAVAQRLLRACQRPELAPLAQGIHLTVENTAVPFVVRAGSVTLSSAVCDSDPSDSLHGHLRHALELCLWHRLAGPHPPQVVSLAIGVLAARCAAVYLGGATLGTGGVLSDVLAWAAGDFLHWDCLPPGAAQCLLALQGIATLQGEPAWRSVRAMVDRSWHLAAPVEVLLTTGGDSRLRVDPARGLNHYGCSPRPRPWAITFASCTSTSISAPAYAAAEELRQKLLADAADARDGFSREVEAIKSALASTYGIASTGQVLLTSSGTDAELYALHLAIASRGDRLLNLVVGPGETGSNVGVAAAGRHFDAVTALGETVCKGALIDGLSPGQVEVLGIPVRTDQGVPLAPDVIDRATEEAVVLGVAAGRRVLVHVLDTSKTGLVAPSPTAVWSLRARWPDTVDVVADACQLRLAPAAVSAYLGHGCMVLVTGSKLFTGPPFSGALLMPPAIAARARTVAPLAGLAAYATHDDWPRPAYGVHPTLSSVQNLGLALRWRAALWEMAAFHDVDPRDARRTLAVFGAAMVQAFDARPHLRLLDAPPIDRAAPDADTVQGTAQDGGWDTLRTIFTFTVTRTRADGARGLASLPELRALYEWLNQDLADCLPAQATDHDRALAARCCHIGQPVVLGSGAAEMAALRICAGARLVSGVAWDPTLGPDPAARLDREIRDALWIFDKLDVLLACFDAVAEALSVRGPRLDGPPLQ